MLQLTLPVARCASAPSPTRVTVPSIFSSSRSARFYLNTFVHVRLRENVSTSMRSPIHGVVAACVAGGSDGKATTATPKKIIQKRRFRIRIAWMFRSIWRQLESIKRNPKARRDEIYSVDTQITSLYSMFDIAVKEHFIEKDTGSRRKYRLDKQRESVIKHHRWKIPPRVAKDSNTPASKPKNVSCSSSSSDQEVSTPAAESSCSSDHEVAETR